MMRTFGLALLCASFIGQSQADNEYPIVLMHGVMGWGRDEAFGIPYWGGPFWDVQEYLDAKLEGESNPARVFTIAVGPLSSNWDRVCEAFAQIKGTKVDYGSSHSQKYGITREGRDYTGKGLYPEWGNIDDRGMVKKVHLVGHSMGGIDARMLTHLLNNGAEENEGDSPLFTGGHDWVASVTTLATPHDGTPLALWLDPFTTLVTGLVGLVAGFSEGQVGSLDDPFYDFKLDQFGLTRGENEGFWDYFDRVKNSPLFDPNYRNTALWSLSPEGALETNKWVDCISNVLYFSYGTSATFRGVLSGTHYPEGHQNLLLQPISALIGRYTRSGDNVNKMNIDKSWWENDGVVPTVVSDGPTGGSCRVERYNRQELDGQQGKFLNIGTKDGWDHLDITGIAYPLFPTVNTLKAFYREVQELVHSTKASAPLPCTGANGCDGAWPTPVKANFDLQLSAAEMDELVARALDPGPGGSVNCADLQKVCSGELDELMQEVCGEFKAMYTDCFDASGATSVAPAFGLVAALVSMFW